MRIEVPCIRCGNAAAAIDPDVTLIPAPIRLLLRSIGAGDVNGAGFDPEAISKVLRFLCIPCVDADVSPSAPAVVSEDSNNNARGLA